MSRSVLPQAKHLAIPRGIVATGFPAINARLLDMGVKLDDWQADATRLIVAKDASGQYATDTVCLSFPRQVGKTFVIGGICFADCINEPGTRVAWTAHRFKVARETFQTLSQFAGMPRVAPHVAEIRTGSGNEVIEFRNGSMIAIASRDRGGLRGFPDVRRVVLDEAQILTEQAMSDIIPTMNVATNAQLIMMGTPPKPMDDSEVFKARRREALDGNPDNLLWIEFGAPDDTEDLDESSAWSIANPSYPYRTGDRAFKRMRKNLTEHDFRREALGVWDSDATRRAVPASTWTRQITTSPPTEGVRCLGLDMSPDRSAVSIAGAVKGDDRLFFESVRYERADAGTAWVVPWIAARRRKVAEVVIDSMSPAMSFVPELKDRKVNVRIVGAAEAARAFGFMVDGLRDGTIWHTAGQREMELAVENATTRNIGNQGGKGWDKLHAEVDICPIVAATNAVFGAATTKRKPGRRSRASV